MNVKLGCPLHLRSDHGTENCTVAALHIAFISANGSEQRERCYINEPSKHNVVLFLRLYCNLCI